MWLFLGRCRAGVGRMATRCFRRVDIIQLWWTAVIILTFPDIFSAVHLFYSVISSYINLGVFRLRASEDIQAREYGDNALFMNVLLYEATLYIYSL